MYFKQEFNATGASQKLSLYRGVYVFECWGATGGDADKIKGASSAYVNGTITLFKHTVFYVYVGKKGKKGTSPSFNGGGKGSIRGGSGGGATDVRLINNDEISGLKSRIIVASGGGGADNYSTGQPGGCGGILKGEDGKENGVKNVLVLAKGGTQESGGEKGYPITGSKNSNGTSGSFGKGGDAANEYYGSGGGAGYFGGGCGSDGPAATSSGAGGSSYISGYQDCLAVNKSMTDPLNPIMLTHSRHYSGLTFRNIVVKEGSELQRDDDGHFTVTYLYGFNCSFAKCNKKLGIYLVTAIITLLVK